MQITHLKWIDEESKKKILSHPDIEKYSASEKKDVFIPSFKITEVSTPNCLRKEYLGYGVQTAPPQLLHPILGIYVRLELTDMELLHRFRSTIEFHINHPSQCIQKIYDMKRLCFVEEKFNVLLLNCEVYRFTLQDLFSLIGQKRIKGFPRAFFIFSRAFLLQAYLNILDLLDHPLTAPLCLSFSLHPANIQFDQFHRLMLGNPFFARSPPASLLAFDNDRKERFMHGAILEEFLALYKRILEMGEIVEILEPQKITQQAFGRKSNYLKVKDEIKLIEAIVQRNNLLSEFPDQEMLEYFKAAERVIAEDSKLTKYQLEKLARSKECLRQRAEQYPN